MYDCPVPSLRDIRALFDDFTITAYQAYSPQIGRPAAASGTFSGTPFKLDRMTWIKPSFLWAMYRSGWARKPGQATSGGAILKMFVLGSYRTSNFPVPRAPSSTSYPTPITQIATNARVDSDVAKMIWAHDLDVCLRVSIIYLATSRRRQALSELIQIAFHHRKGALSRELSAPDRHRIIEIPVHATNKLKRKHLKRMIRRQLSDDPWAKPDIAGHNIPSLSDFKPDRRRPRSVQL